MTKNSPEKNYKLQAHNFYLLPKQKKNNVQFD